MCVLFTIPTAIGVVASLTLVNSQLAVVLMTAVHEVITRVYTT